MMEAFRPDECDYTPTLGRAKKTVTLQNDDQLTPAEALLCCPSKEVIKADIGSWPRELIIDLAKFFHPTKLFGPQSANSARAYLECLFNGTKDGVSWESLLPPNTDLEAIVISDLLHLQLRDLREWTLSLGIFPPGSQNLPGALLHHVSHIASFVHGPLTPETFEEKRGIIEEVFRTIKRFCSTQHLHPSAFITLTLSNQVLSDPDVARLAVAFKITGVEVTWTIENIRTACRAVGTNVLLTPHRLHNEAHGLERLPQEWLDGIHLYMVVYLLRVFDMERLSDFTQLSHGDKVLAICDAVSKYIRSSQFDHTSIDWLHADPDTYNDVLISLRTFNAFDPYTIPEDIRRDPFDLVRCKALSFKHILGDEGSGNHFADLLEQLDLPLLQLRADFTIHGPADGRPINPFHDPLGPASDEFPRHYMSEVEGAAYVLANTPRPTPSSPAHSLADSIASSLQFDEPPFTQRSNYRDPASRNHYHDMMGGRSQDLHVSSSASQLSASVANSQSIQTPTHFRSHQGEMLAYNDFTRPPVVTSRKRTIDSTLDWLTPIAEASNIQEEFEPWDGTPEEVVHAAIQWGEEFDSNTQPTSTQAELAAVRFPGKNGSQLRPKNIIMVPDPSRKINSLSLDYNTLIKIPLTALYVVSSTRDNSGKPTITVRVIANNVNKVIGVHSTWTPLNTFVTTARPAFALIANHEMEQKYTLLGAQQLLHEPSPKRTAYPQAGEKDTANNGNHRVANNASNNSSSNEDHILSYGGNTYAQPPVAPSTPTPPPNNTSAVVGVPIGNGITYSKTSINITDKARTIPWLAATVEPELLDTFTAGQPTLVNAYVMDRILPKVYQYWLKEIDADRQSPNLIYILDVLKKSTLAVHLSTAHPDIAIAMFTWDWRSSNCLDQKSLYLEYMLPADNYQIITTMAQLYLALSSLDKFIFLLFGWTNTFLPILEKMRPMEGIYDRVCSVAFWSTRIYSMLSECSKTTTLSKNSNVTSSPSDNKARIVEIIANTAKLPFDHTSNLRFDSEHQRRIKCPDPLTFGDKSDKGKPKGTTPPATGTGSTPNNKTPAANPAGKKATKPTNAAAEIVPRDFSAYTEAGIPVPPYPKHAPRPRLCFFDVMHSLKVPHDDGKVPPKCNLTHSMKAGLRNTTRLHMDELLTHFPEGYSKEAAKYQCCYWLNEKPQQALKIIAAIEKDTTHFK
jgi:hypothetical protein